MTSPIRPGALDARLDALGLVGPLRRDGALAVGLATVTLALLVPLVLAPGPVADLGVGAGTWATAITLGTVQALLLTLRRARPVTTVAAVAVLQVALVVLLPAGVVFGGVATAVAAYTCATLLTARRTTFVVGAAAVAELLAGVVALAVGTTKEPTWVLIVGLVLRGALFHAAPALGGVLVAARRRYAADALAAHRDRADAAVARERTRMARELHDVAAHHLSAMVVQAAVVERTIDRDPEQAKRTAAAVREQGRRTLRDLRLVVGALREGDPGDPAGEVPVRGLADMEALVADVEQLGAAVVLERHGTPVDLTPIADLTCHRVAQEALANAREHAPGAPVRLVVAHDDDRVRVEIVNGPPVTSGASPDGRRGFGLAGMRERAHLVGATFEAGPTDDGGWRVRLVVPRHTEGDTP